MLLPCVKGNERLFRQNHETRAWLQSTFYSNFAVATTNSTPRREAALESLVATSGRLLGGRFRRSPTFARLHYHGPGGLNGRVRNGNGCDPAGMVAGKAAGGLSRHAGRNSFPLCFRWSITRSSSCGSQRHPLSKASRARSHLTSDQNLNQNPESMSNRCQMSHIRSFAIALSSTLGIGESTLGSVVCAFDSGGEPIGVVKLLGC